MNKVLWVSPDGERWKLHWENGDTLSQHGTQTEAIAAARDHVGKNPKGSVHQIRVQRPDGTIREEWTYGHDPERTVG